MIPETITDDDVGKRVISASGVPVGHVTATQKGVVFVEPDAKITSTLVAMLGWKDGIDEGSLRVESGAIERITDHEVHLKK